MARKSKRDNIKDAVMIKIIRTNGESWIEEKCWKCGKVLKKHFHPILSVHIEKVPCPNCKAVNLVEMGE